MEKSIVLIRSNSSTLPNAGPAESHKACEMYVSLILTMACRRIVLDSKKELNDLLNISSKYEHTPMSSSVPPLSHKSPSYISHFFHRMESILSVGSGPDEEEKAGKIMQVGDKEPPPGSVGNSLPTITGGSSFGNDQLFKTAQDLTNTFEVQAAFILHRKNPLDEDDGMRLFALLDTKNTGRIEIKEILRETQRAAVSEAHDLIWRYSDTPLAHLRNRRALTMLFGTIHTTQSDGSIGLGEWRAFLARLMQHDHNYLRVKGLATLRPYYGKGRGVQSEEDISIQTNEKDLVWGCVDPAWWADFSYYQCNHHPLLALLFADSDNPLTSGDRLKIEFAVNSWNLYASTIVFGISETQGLLYLISFALVTVPVMLIRTALLHLFACPCLHIRNSHPRHYQRACLVCCRRTGHSLGTFYVLGGVAFLVLGVLSALRAGSGFVRGWVFSWALSYLLCVVVDLCLKFNTNRACVALRRSRVARCFCLGLVQQSGLCQWQLEKDKVLATMAGGSGVSEDCAPSSQGTSIRSDSESENSPDGGGSYFSTRSSRKWSYRYKGLKQSKILPV